MKRALGLPQTGARVFSRRGILGGISTLLIFSATTGASANPGPEPENRAADIRDHEASPTRHGVLFVGSSSIRHWPIRTYFPSLPSLNRGIDGSQIADVNHWLARIVFRYEPKVIVFYSGDNDIWAGKPPEVVLSDYQEFVTRVHQRLPETRIVFISIKPSILRRPSWGKMREANRLVEEFCRSDERLSYADVATPMLDTDGSPRRELFARDGLHLNGQGYRLWTGVVSPILEQAYERP